MVKVLIVDDSAFVRRSLTSLLEANKDIEIVGTASNGEDAVKKAKELDPDVITMDVEMPRMDGLTALQRIMEENPVPVIMVSSLTNEGADTTLKALELGALDFMPKLSSGSMPDVKAMEKDLVTKIKTLARRKAIMRLMFNRTKTAPKRSVPRTASAGLTGHAHTAPAAPEISLRRKDYSTSDFHRPFEVVSIGVSTGGPPAVQKVLSQLPATFPVPILIAQHMPAAFTGPFAARLNAQCAIAVKEAEPIERIRSGTVYICPGGKHLRLENRGGTLMAVVTEEPKEALYKPSANVLMETTGIAVGRKGLGITLTGMGNDGLEGTKVLKEKGGWTIAQNEVSCVVYGMPKAVVDHGLADEIVDINDMAAAILAHFVRK